MSHLLIAQSNPNIGMYGLATDSYCLLGRGFTHEFKEELKKVLKVPVIEVNLCGTPLVGVFAAANSHCLLLPSIIFDSEEHVIKKAGIKYTKLDTALTAMGNNIIVNDNYCLVNPNFTDNEIESMKKAFEVKVERLEIEENETVGSLAALNRNGCVISNEIEDSEIAKIGKKLKLECMSSTINISSPYIRSGILCNSNGMVVSRMSGGPEIMYAEQALGFARG